MSHINVTPYSTSFVGRDSVALYSAIAIRASLRLFVATKGKLKPTRNWTLREALASCTPYTGQTYRASQPEARRAVEDLTVWIETMKSALPVFNTAQSADTER